MLQIVNFISKMPVFKAPFYGQEHFFREKRLDNDVKGAFFNGSDDQIGFFQIAETDDWRLGTDLIDLFQQANTVATLQLKTQ